MWLQRLQAHRILMNTDAGWLAGGIPGARLDGYACCGVACPFVCWVSCLLGPLALVSKFTLIGVVSSFQKSNWSFQGPSEGTATFHPPYRKLNFFSLVLPYRI